MTSLLVEVHASRVGIMGPFPPSHSDDYQICIRHDDMIRTVKKDANGLRKISEKLQVFWMRTLGEFDLTSSLLTFYLLIGVPLVANLNYI